MSTNIDAEPRPSGSGLGKFTVALLLAANATHAQTAAELGRAVYRIYCSSCHGKTAQGGRAPDLTRTDDADLLRVIAEGVPGTEMGAYATRMGAEDMRRIVAFIRSMTSSDAPFQGDVAKGAELFWGKGVCGGCHAVAGRGNMVGPDLSRIGRRRSAQHLRESLVEPSAQIAPNFSAVTVETREHQAITGIEKALDDFSVVLTDLAGKTYSFDRIDLRSVKRETRSLMPGYKQTFTDVEMNDLLAYMLSLR